MSLFLILKDHISDITDRSNARNGSNFPTTEKGRSQEKSYDQQRSVTIWNYSLPRQCIS